MPTQSTAPEVIEREMQLVQKLAGVSKGAVAPNDAGWDSRVYSVNGGQYFVKFPRSEKIRGRYTYEIAALRLAAQLGPAIQVPKIKWTHPANDYFGYEGVPGLGLGEIIPALDESAKQAVGEAIGEFLKKFHRLELPGTKARTVEQEIAQLQEWYEPAVPVIRQYLSEAERQKLDNLVGEVWPREVLELGRDAALCHGDLGIGNIFYDNGRVGIIDFGDVGYYDRSKDFIGLEDLQVLEAALVAYGDHENLRQKIAARRVVPPIIGLRFYIDKKDGPGVQRKLASIKVLLDEN